MTYAPINTRNAFLPTSEAFSGDQQQFLVKLPAVYTNIANAVNVREIALHEDGQQILTGNQYSIPGNTSTKRYSFRKTFYFGAIPANTDFHIAHGLTGVVQYTKIYGTYKTATDFRPLPYVSINAADRQVSLRVDATDIHVHTGLNARPIVSGIVEIEYFLN